MELKKIFSPKYLFHFLLWILVTVSLALDVTWLYTYNKALFFIYIFSKNLVMAVIVYANLLFFYPVFFKKKKYGLYILCILLITIVAGYINMELELGVNGQPLTHTGWKHFLFFLNQLAMALRYILFSFFLQITVDYYLQKEKLKKIELQKTTAELNLLKAQVNPHFLFNTLNNLYALILEKSDKSGEAVLKLADIMKYILAEGNTDKVILQKEIQLLYNYTELERLRKPGAEIIFHSQGEALHYFITPLLLLPLVENAFKYGLNSVARDGFVRIHIAAGAVLHVTVENNIPPVTNDEALQSLGIGISNVKQRLELLYPGKYTLTINKNAGSFFVDLQLQLA